MHVNILVLTSHKLRVWLTPHSTVVWVIKYGASLCGTEVITFTSKKLSFNHLSYRSFNGWYFIVTNAIWLTGSVFQRPRLCGYWLLWMFDEMNGTAFTVQCCSDPLNSLFAVCSKCENNCVLTLFSFMSYRDVEDPKDLYRLYLLPECSLSHFTTTVEMSDWNLLSALSGKAYLRHGSGFCKKHQTWKLFQSVRAHPVNTASSCLVFQQVFLQNDSTPSLQSLTTCCLCYVCLGLLFVGPFLVLSSLRWRKYQT